jgi:hypothetical protein
MLYDLDVYFTTHRHIATAYQQILNWQLPVVLLLLTVPQMSLAVTVLAI